METNCHKGLLGHGKDFFTFTMSENLGSVEWFGLEKCHEPIEDGKGQPACCICSGLEQSRDRSRRRNCRLLRPHRHILVTSVSEYAAETKKRIFVWVLCMFFLTESN